MSPEQAAIWKILNEKRTRWYAFEAELKAARCHADALAERASEAARAVAEATSEVGEELWRQLEQECDARIAAVRLQHLAPDGLGDGAIRVEGATA